MQQEVQAPVEQTPIEPLKMEPAAWKPMETSAFKAGGVAEFIPKGKMVATQEQFPDFDALGDEPKQKRGKKGKKKTVVQITKIIEEEPVDESTPWKGKQSSFFNMETASKPLDDPTNPGNFEMNDEQWKFIFKFYPEYGANPYDMMIWLYGQSKNIEDINSDAYGKPQNSGQVAGEEEGDMDTLQDSKYDKGFGKGKQQNKKDQKAATDLAKEAQLKKLQELKDRAGPGQTDAEKEERKIMRVYKDKEINMEPEGLVEVDQKREPCSMVFIGHVDAGKSTICGNLMYMMGVVDARTIEKYKAEAKEKGRDSWWLAYVMDVSDDEKAKGKTVEVGRAQFDTPNKKYTIFDAPGHKNYVPNMIMGAALADVGGLVISARKGEFEAGFEKEGQTREHALLAKSLGVQKLVVIVNKMDECKWAKSRWDEIQTKLTPFLRKTGYKDEDVIYVPIAGLTGENINEKSENGKWYTGPTMMEILDQVKLYPRYP